MKTIWTILTTLALANLLALAAFVGWLVAGDRLNGERIEAIRAVLGTTVAEEQALADERRLDAERRAAEVADAARYDGMPIPADEVVRDRITAEQIGVQLSRRQQREIDDLRQSLSEERGELDQAWNELEAAKAAFAQYLAGLEETVGSDQFKKTIHTLEGQKPQAAMSILQAMLDLSRTDDVVSYLDAVSERQRNRIFAEFEKKDPALAADLLDRLRTRGIRIPDPEGSTE